MIYPMHGSCIERSMFPKYTDAIFKQQFAYNGKLLGQDIEIVG
jgi:hypothetical protein